MSLTAFLLLLDLVILGIDLVLWMMVLRSPGHAASSLAKRGARKRATTKRSMHDRLKAELGR